MQVVVVVFIFNLLFMRSQENTILLFLKKYGIYIGLGLAFFSMALSLFYSEVIGFPPCELCIIERCFIYPQVLFFGIYLWKRPKWVLPLISITTFLGTLVSVYHIYVENGGESGLSCVTNNIHAISCSARYVYEFGYVTIPVMAVTTQVLMLLLAINYWYVTKNSSK